MELTSPLTFPAVEEEALRLTEWRGEHRLPGSEGPGCSVKALQLIFGRDSR